MGHLLLARNQQTFALLTLGSISWLPMLKAIRSAHPHRKPVRPHSVSCMWLTGKATAPGSSRRQVQDIVVAEPASVVGLEPGCLAGTAQTLSPYSFAHHRCTVEPLSVPLTEVFGPTASDRKTVLYEGSGPIFNISCVQPSGVKKDHTSVDSAEAAGWGWAEL